MSGVRSVTRRHGRNDGKGGTLVRFPWRLHLTSLLSIFTSLWLTCSLCFGHEVAVRGAVLGAIGHIVWLWPTINIAVLREWEWLPRSGASTGSVLDVNGTRSILLLG